MLANHEPNTKRRNEKVAVIDFFCGAGGLAYGLKSAGLNVIAGVDFDPACRHPLEANTGANFYLRDIAEVTATDLNEWFGKTKIRVLAGCAPCQPFSKYSQSRKTPSDQWGLLKHFQRLVEEVKPEIVTMENVIGLATKDIWAEFVAALEDLDYSVDWKSINCQDYGVAQTRERLVLLASRLGVIELIKPKMDETRTVKDVIGGLPKIAAGEHLKSDPLHCAASLSDTNLVRIRASKPGGTWRDWPEELRAACHTRSTGKSYPSVYGRMEWEKPSPTITTQCFGFGNGRFGHPEQNRAISLREAALLQSFPKEYSFLEKKEVVSFATVGRLIGNAVPPKLGELIGKSIKSHLKQVAQARSA